MRMTLNELAFNIDAALTAKFIWNVDFESLKYNFSKLLEDAMKAAQNVYLDNRPNGPGSSYDNAALNELYYFNPAINSFGKFNRLLVAADDTLKPTQSEEIGAYWSAYDTFQPIATALNDLKQYIKKGRKPSDDPTKTPARTIDHTGTCPICGRNIKIENGTMYSHGFVVKGYREGNCFGVGYPPIEVSDRGAKAFLGALKGNKAANLEEIARLKASDSLDKYLHDGSKKTLKRGEARFERLLESEVSQLDSMNRMITHDIATFEEVVKNWTPTPLPDGNQEHMKGGRE